MSWDEPPPPRFLRHNTDEFNVETRARVHTSLRKLGLDIPTAAEENSEHDRALALYADPRLIRLLLWAFAIQDRLEHTPDLTLKKIAEADGMSASYCRELCPARLVSVTSG